MNKQGRDYKNPKFSLSDVKLLQKIGCGSFGTVRLCRMIQSNVYYAIKIVRVEDKYTSNEQNIMRQLDHFLIMVSLKHTKSLN